MIKYNNGMPMYWRNETSGQMQEAVEAYWQPIAEQTSPDDIRSLSDKHIEIIRMYLLHWAQCPAWRDNPYLDSSLNAELDKAVSLAKNIKTRSDISETLKVLLNLAIDPF